MMKGPAKRVTINLTLTIKSPKVLKHFVISKKPRVSKTQNTGILTSGLFMQSVAGAQVMHVLVINKAW